MHRFFAPSLDPGDETITLPKDEAEHLIRVLRLGAGDTIAVFDGRGHEFLARVIAASRREARVQLLSRLEPVPEATVPLTLVQALLKGERMDDVVRDAVMLGVVAIQPLVTHRTEVTVASLLRSARVDRWRRVALASAKQSRRAVVPEIRMPLTLEHYLNDRGEALQIMLVEPGAQGDTEWFGALSGEPPPAEAAIWVGPEGGWDERELAAAKATGVRLMSLNRRTLRADAVPVAAISVLEFLWGR